MAHLFNRRTFTKAGLAAATAVSAVRPAAAMRPLGANDRIRLGFIGVANRGRQDLAAFRKYDDCEVAALCDVSRSTMEQTNESIGGKAMLFDDFRDLIARDDIDAVVVAAPDHWHALMTIAACNAGKDVYIEKPLSMTIYEGRKMVEAARRNERVVQVGTHRRSGNLYHQAAEMIASGRIGKVTIARAYHRSNMTPVGIGHSQPSDPPADLNWDLWLGPRPMRPYQDNITPYKFRWWDLYSSQIANQGVHFLDMMRMLLGDLAPSAVCAMGGRYAVDDDRTIPDTMEVCFEFPTGWLGIFGVYEANGNPTMARSAFVELRGSKGTMYVTDQTIELVPETGGQFQDQSPRIEAEIIKGTDGDLTEQHARNFLDCIRSRQQPAADVEIGHRSTTMSLLANISLATQSRLQWDAEKEQVVGNDAANALLHYEYREPWKLD